MRRFDGLVQRYRCEPPEPIAGAARVFEWLRRRGVRIALTTGFDRDVTRVLLGALAWEHDVVDAVVCGDDVQRGRPAPLLKRGWRHAPWCSSVVAMIDPTLGRATS